MNKGTGHPDRILKYVSANGGCTTADISSQFAISKQHATSTLRILMQRGLVRSEATDTLKRNGTPILRWYADPLELPWYIPPVTHSPTTYQCRGRPIGHYYTGL